MLLYHGYINHILRPWAISYTTGDINIWYPTGDKYFATIKSKTIFCFQYDFFCSVYIRAYWTMCDWRCTIINNINIFFIISFFFWKFFENKKNINLHLSQKRLEIEQKGFGITFIVNGHSITFLNILILIFLIFEHFNKCCL